MRGFLVLLLMLASGVAGAQTSTVACTHGEVFEDRDGDGSRDRGEPGLAGIAMSNGHDIIRSDADGAYRLPPRAGAEVFVICLLYTSPSPRD